MTMIRVTGAVIRVIRVRRVRRVIRVIRVIRVMRVKMRVMRRRSSSRGSLSSTGEECILNVCMKSCGLTCLRRSVLFARLLRVDLITLEAEMSICSLSVRTPLCTSVQKFFRFQ